MIYLHRQTQNRPRGPLDKGIDPGSPGGPGLAPLAPIWLPGPGPPCPELQLRILFPGQAPGTALISHVI